MPDSITSSLSYTQPISYKLFSDAKVLLQAIQIYRFITNHFQKIFEGLFLKLQKFSNPAPGTLTTESVVISPGFTFTDLVIKV